ncbi:MULTISPECIES: hypothetical protein [Ralstonia solanacearum species complex]|uniref:hypothetical protein n=1 Tax=Ralstonia solanacearum species complex TaxID=3116862 RepID=UPI0004D578A2|nr:hypothetical protein [Ralstonia solanacearum]ATI30027.1 hypothetical protein CCY86_21485 [Ralstonia solanacearum]ATJ88767.1 hypothetical protein CDC59_21365 [Ralstonia solanacearum]KEI32686.1 hypothetical protein CQ06_14770 [Ralstonia solanacearum]KFX76729.1 hypothetical protein KR98_23155 [Ralstonia solanacearum]KFX83036.1 hypothetical protein KR99_14265 [Ralstonia solanacearum]
MSIALNVEIDNRLAWSSLRDVLVGMELFISHEGQAEIRGGMPLSNMYVVAEVVNDPSRMHPVTEGADFAKDWVIGTRVGFYYVMSQYDQCSLEMNQFISKLMEVSDAYFIVAFENEKILAVRDQDGLRVLDKF